MEGRNLLERFGWWRWWKELRRRWPILVAVLRGRTVVYNAIIGRGGYFINVPPNGGCIYDSLIDGTGWTYDARPKTRPIVPPTEGGVLRLFRDPDEDGTAQEPT
jgi:hypothetical protein